MDLPPPPAAETVAVEAPLADSLAHYVRETCDVGKVQVLHVGTDLTIEDADTIVWMGDACRPQPTLTLRAGSERRTIRPALALWVEGPVAPKDISENESFVVETGLIPWVASRANTLEGTVMSRKPIRAGQPVTPANAKRIPDAAQGDAVAVVITVGTISIRAEGEILTPGFIGDRVAVRNRSTHAIQRGLLVNATTVSLSP